MALHRLMKSLLACGTICNDRHSHLNTHSPTFSQEKIKADHDVKLINSKERYPNLKKNQNNV